MKMFEAILQYVRSWFPANEYPRSSEISRKRRAPDNFNYFKNSKHRKILSSMTNNIIEDDIYVSPLRSSTLRSTNLNKTVIIDDDEDEKPASKAVDIKGKSNENHLKMNGNDDVSYLKTIKSSTEKKLDANKNGYEYITRFTSSLEPLTKSSKDGTKPKQKSTPTSKSQKPGRSSSNSSFSSPTLDYSIRLDDKKKYQMLLENVASQNSLNSTFNSSSIYETPVGSFLNRSKKMMEMCKSPKHKRFGIIDLTSDDKTKLKTKDRVIKILDDLEEANVIEDSDSDVEILPTPPSPKPDIKVTPVNSLKTVIETSKPAQHKWLQDVTKRHEEYVVGKTREIQAYEENATALNQINRNMIIQSLTRRVQDALTIKEAILPEIEIIDEVELPELTEDQLRLVKRAFSGDPNEILTKKFNLNLNRRDILTLSGLNWLNDNIVNFYMNLLLERGKDPKWPPSYAMNTFFYQKLISSGPESLKRWTRKIDLFSYEIICVPIHLGMHWCMAIINLKEKTIKYYDSMGKPNNQCLNALRNYLEFEHMDKKNEPYSTRDFVLENVQDIPQQMNGSDCGMFSCTFAEYATRRARFTFQQEDMPYFRKKMVVEILTGELLIQ